MTILLPNSEFDIPPSPFDSHKVKANKKFPVMPFFYIAGTLIVAATLFIYTGLKTKNTDTLDNKKIIKEVSSKIDLPDETPTVIKVTDPQKIKNNQFLSKADIGDLVLIFPNSKKAILYRPSQSKIIEVGKVQNEGSVAGEKTTASPSPNSNVLTPTITPQPTSTESASPAQSR